MLRVTDAEHGLREVTGLLRVAPVGDDVGTLLAVDTLARTAEVLGLRVRTVGVEGLEALNIRPANASGPVDLTVYRAGGVASPPYGLAHRLAWLVGSSLDDAEAELAQWRRLVAGWAEEPSRPMCAQVQQDLLAALADDLRTADAVAVLRGSLDLGLPDGCLFETWAWADRLLALDLASEVGR